MNTSIIRNFALALSLSIAPIGLASAQDEEIKKPMNEEGAAEQLQQDGEAGATIEGEAGAPTAEEGGTAERPVPEGEAGSTAEGEATMPPEGEEGTAAMPSPEGETDTTEAPADDGESATTAEEGSGSEAPADTTAESGAPDTQTTGSINITAEQETEFTQIIRETEVEPVEVDIEISVGTTVPETVTLHPLPPRIVEIVPEYEGYLYFILADGTIIIVAQDTHEIVYVIA